MICSNEKFSRSAMVGGVPGASAVLALMERIAAIARLPLRRHHSRKSLIEAAAFLIANAMTSR